MSGFLPDGPWTDQVSVKRENYVHCVVQLICQLTYQSDVSADDLAPVLANLMSDVEAVQLSSESCSPFSHPDPPENCHLTVKKLPKT